MKNILQILIVFNLLCCNLFSQTPTTFTDIRNNCVYKTIHIGHQIWMAENLNYKTGSGSWCYNDSLKYCYKYGRLYNYEAAINACPKGWHLPSDEWCILEKKIGMQENELQMGGERGETDNVGGKLKSKHGWKKNNVGATNQYGFSALASGCRYVDEGYDEMTSTGYWWTATSTSIPPAITACVRQLVNENGKIRRRFIHKKSGISVRCVKNKVN